MEDSQLVLTQLGFVLDLSPTKDKPIPLWIGTNLNFA